MMLAASTALGMSNQRRVTLPNGGEIVRSVFLGEQDKPSAPDPLQPQFYLELGGAPAPTELLSDLDRIEVDLSLYLPDSFTIEIHDERFRWAGDALLKIGQEVQIGGRAAENETKPSEMILIGEVTAIEANYNESGVPTLIVHGYDRARVHTLVHLHQADTAQGVTCLNCPLDWRGTSPLGK